MTKKEELQQAISIVEKDKEVSLELKANQLLNLVKLTTQFDIYISNIVGCEYIEINFKKQGENWGCDFTISYSNYRGLEFNHSLGISCGEKYRNEIKPFIKERDKIIGLLWDYEEKIIQFFKELKGLADYFDQRLNDLNYDLREVEHEEAMKEFNEAMAQVIVGRQFKWKNDHIGFIYVIDKITPQRVYVKHGGCSEIYEKKSFARSIKNGGVIWLDEVK